MSEKCGFRYFQYRKLKSVRRTPFGGLTILDPYSTTSAHRDGADFGRMQGARREPCQCIETDERRSSRPKGARPPGDHGVQMWSNMGLAQWAAAFGRHHHNSHLAHCQNNPSAMPQHRLCPSIHYFVMTETPIDAGILAAGEYSDRQFIVRFASSHFFP
jgi:hypothetical protein